MSSIAFVMEDIFSEEELISLIAAFKSCIRALLTSIFSLILCTNFVVVSTLSNAFPACSEILVTEALSCSMDAACSAVPEASP